MLEDGRFVLINRGFVPYEKKDPSTRIEGQIDGPVNVTGLARDPLSAKPGFFLPIMIRPRIFSTGRIGRPWRKVPTCQIWMRSCPSSSTPTASPIRGLPVGGVTIIDFPNNHLQYAATWYGLALALIGVVGTWLWRYRKTSRG